jgi:hypothetical protein
MKERKLHVVFVTLYGGVHGATAYHDNSGTLIRSNVNYYDRQLQNAVSDLQEGGFAIDRRFCEDPTIALQFPHLDCILMGNQCGQNVWPENLLEYHGEISIEGFKSQNIGRVSPKLYVDLSRKYGAVIGVRKDSQMIWEHGLRTSVERKLSYGEFDPWLDENRVRFLKDR